MKLRVGLVGVGSSWETRHRVALRSLADRFEIKAVCSAVAQRAEQVALEFKACPVDGFRAVAGRNDVDAVMLLSSRWYGTLPILAACDQGKAIYCATDLEVDLSRAREMKTRVEQSGVAFMAEFPRRHAPATLRLKELIATRLGKPRLLFCHTRMAVDEVKDPECEVARGRFATRELLELIDWCRYVVGSEPTSVLGVAHNQAGRELLPDGSPARDYGMMSLDFSAGLPGEGPLAQISCGRYLPASWSEAITFRPPAALQVACDRGIAFIDLPSTLIWFDEAGRHMESLESERPVAEQMLTQFHRSVTSLIRKTSDLEDAYRALQIVDCARRSFMEGHRVELV